MLFFIRLPLDVKSTFCNIMKLYCHKTFLKYIQSFPISHTLLGLNFVDKYEYIQTTAAFDPSYTHLFSLKTFNIVIFMFFC